MSKTEETRKPVTSPFRYPGGKAKLSPQITPYLTPWINSKTIYVEPYIGGGSVLCAVLNHVTPAKIVINDLDPAVSAFWKCLCHPETTEELVRLINTTVVTVGEHSRQRSLLASPEPVLAGFAALFLNRTSHSGRLRSGPMGGKYQSGGSTGIVSRWNPSKLEAQIYTLHTRLRDRTIVESKDASEIISQNDQAETVIYADPPYVKAGMQQYRIGHFRENHEALATAIRGLRKVDTVITSYDEHPLVRELWSEPFFTIHEISASYSNSGRRSSNLRTHELVVVKNRVATEYENGMLYA